MPGITISTSETVKKHNEIKSLKLIRNELKKITSVSLVSYTMQSRISNKRLKIIYLSQYVINI